MTDPSASHTPVLLPPFTVSRNPHGWGHWAVVSSPAVRKVRMHTRVLRYDGMEDFVTSDYVVPRMPGLYVFQSASTRDRFVRGVNYSNAGLETAFAVHYVSA